MDVTETAHSVISSFNDRAKALQPLNIAEPDTASAARQRRVGGLSVFMVKKTMHEAACECRHGMNILTVRKMV